LAAALDEAGDRDTTRLDLPRGDPAVFRGLEAEVAEGDLAATVRHAGPASPLLLPELDLARHQHGAWSSSLAARVVGDADLARLPAVDPHLDADDAVGRARLGEAVIDLGAEGVERKAPLKVALGSRDLGAGEAAADLDLDPLRPEAQGRLDRLAH